MERTSFPIEILSLDMATFTFADDEPDAGEEGVVVAFVIRHPSGDLLFDTGIGFGSQEMEIGITRRPAT